MAVAYRLTIKLVVVYTQKVAASLFYSKVYYPNNTQYFPNNNWDDL